MNNRLNRWSRRGNFLVLALLLASQITQGAPPPLTPKWERWERPFTSSAAYTNVLSDVDLQVVFTSPAGDLYKVQGFWDGGKNWKVRFCPNLAGRWSYRTFCSDPNNRGLHNQAGEFLCTVPAGKNRFTQHGPVRVARDGRSLAHEDGTPFFWLADTAWNGPLQATDREWQEYLRVRSEQKFTTVQWVTTQWRAAPKGNRKGQLPYTSSTNGGGLKINPAFFQDLDRRVEEMNQAGLLAAPVMLWAIQGGSNPAINPGVSLPEDQATLLCRHMVARWGANHLLWLLNGDGDYRGAKAEKWRRIGRAVFGDISHAPVTLHPGGGKWVLDDFLRESWYDVCGYQSLHNASPDNLRWITSGPASREWKKPPTRPFISLEAPYENHSGGKSGPMSADVVRRAHYWSLLNAPTAGVTYGAHGVWGWDDGTKPPLDHPNSGTPLPWRQALQMPGAHQMTLLAQFFTSIPFGKLRPAPELLARQPGTNDPAQFISAAASEARDVLVFYVPCRQTVEIKLEALTALKSTANPAWHNPRTGARMPAIALVTEEAVQFPTPDDGDWLLVMAEGKR